MAEIALQHLADAATDGPGQGLVGEDAFAGCFVSRDAHSRRGDHLLVQIQGLGQLPLGAFPLGDVAANAHD